eukprot:6038468-Alexandrium_andersonii.AAC.1
MSASLVGSEMCIRDSQKAALAMAVGSRGPLPRKRARAFSCTRRPQGVSDMSQPLLFKAPAF